MASISSASGMSVAISDALLSGFAFWDAANSSIDALAKNIPRPSSNSGNSLTVLISTRSRLVRVGRNSPFSSYPHWFTKQRIDYILNARIKAATDRRSNGRINSATSVERIEIGLVKNAVNCYGSARRGLLSWVAIWARTVLVISTETCLRAPILGITGVR